MLPKRDWVSGEVRIKDILLGMKSYIRRQVPVIAAAVLISVIIVILFWLYRLPLEMGVYLIIMEAFVLGVTEAVRFYGYYRKHLQLHSQKSVIENEMITLPEPGTSWRRTIRNCF